MSDRLRELMFAIKYKRSALDNVEIRRLYTVEGLSLTDIAERFGCSHSSIGRRLAAMGIERRPFRRPAATHCFCGKPAFKAPNDRGIEAGTRCKLHWRLARAEACRNFVRRRRQIPPERWRVTGESVRVRRVG